MERAIKILDTAYNQASYNIEIEEAYLSRDDADRELIPLIRKYIRSQSDLMVELMEAIEILRLEE